MAKLEELATPCLLVDRERLEANAAGLARHLAGNGISLRLHAKTCKSAAIARICLGGDGPLAVSTLAEAEYFASSGMKDIVYAVGMAPQKLQRLLELRKTGAKVFLVLDNRDTALEVAKFAKSQKHVFDVLLEVDCDGHRGGLDPDSPEFLLAASILLEAGQNISGVLTHAGSAYELPKPGPAAFAALAETERARAVRAAEVLRAAGHACGMVSVGSTPTALFCENFTGITEVRAGVYIFQDCVMAALGVCGLEDIALSVLCSVIGRRNSDGGIIIDAGWTALSSDRGLAGKFPTYGYGLVCDLEGRLMPHLRVWNLNQEHGIICAQPGFTAPSIPAGTLLRILPIHACATANAFASFHAVSGNSATAIWPRCRGW